MTHGDDQGLILPPNLAPIPGCDRAHLPQGSGKSEGDGSCQPDRKGLKDFRVKVDDRDGLTPGFKFNDWEMKGVPLRIEIGPKDVEKGSMVLARRDILGKAGKSFIPMEGYVQAVGDMLDAIQANLLVKATKFRDEHIFEVEDYETFKDVVENKGWALGWWYDDAENEAKVKEDTRATLRVFALLKAKAPASSAERRPTKKSLLRQGLLIIFLVAPKKQVWALTMPVFFIY